MWLFHYIPNALQFLFLYIINDIFDTFNIELFDKIAVYVFRGCTVLIVLPNDKSVKPEVSQNSSRASTSIANENTNNNVKEMKKKSKKDLKNVVHEEECFKSFFCLLDSNPKFVSASHSFTHVLYNRLAVLLCSFENFWFIVFVTLLHLLYYFG